MYFADQRRVKNKMPLCEGAILCLDRHCDPVANNSQGKNYLPQVMMLTTMITAKIVAVTSLPCTSTLWSKVLIFFITWIFVFKNGLRQVFKGAEVAGTYMRCDSKGVRRLKTERSNSYIFQNNIRALIIVLKMVDIFINRKITNEKAEV